LSNSGLAVPTVLEPMYGAVFLSSLFACS